MDSSNRRALTLVIDGGSRVPGSSLADARYIIPLDRSQYENAYYCSVTEVSFTRTITNINSTNNVFAILELGGSVELLSIPETEYTNANVGPAINLAISTSGLTGVYSVVYNSTTQKYTITSTVDWIFVDVFEDRSDIYDELGYDRYGDAFQTYALSHVADGIVQLDGFEFVDIVSNIPSNYHTSTTVEGVLGRIPLSASLGERQIYQSQHLDYHYVTGHDLHELRIALRTPKGIPMPIPETSPFVLKLRLEMVQGPPPNLPEDHRKRPREGDLPPHHHEHTDYEKRHHQMPEHDGREQRYLLPPFGPVPGMGSTSTVSDTMHSMFQTLGPMGLAPF